MKMRDKLIKFNRKAPYYVMKKCAISFSVLVAFAVTIAVPVSLKVTMRAPEAPHADNEAEHSTSEVLEDNNTEETNDDEVTKKELLSY